MYADVHTRKSNGGGPVFMDLQDYAIRQDSLMTYTNRLKFLLVDVNSGQPILSGSKIRPKLIEFGPTKQHQSNGSINDSR